MTLDAPPWSGVRLRPRGSRSDPGSSVPVHQRLFSPIRPTRGHIAISPTMRLIRDAFAVRERLSDPRVVPSFRCTFLPGMPPSMSRDDQKSCFSSLTIPTWPSPRSERLGSSGYPAIRFKQGSFAGLLVHHCCGLSGCSPPLTDLTGSLSSHEGFYIQAFNESVTFLTAGYHYDRLWTFLSVGLSPTRTAASFAAPDPDKRDSRIRLLP